CFSSSRRRHTRFSRDWSSDVCSSDLTPDPDAVLIADDVRALALGGIMGGEESGVTTATTEIFLESAFFAPEVIAGKARALNFSKIGRASCRERVSDQCDDSWRKVHGE